MRRGFCKTHKFGKAEVDIPLRMDNGAWQAALPKDKNVFTFAYLEPLKGFSYIFEQARMATGRACRKKL